MAMATKKDTRNYERDAELLAVLASPVRLQVLALLHACPDGLSLTDITELVNQRRAYPLASSTVGSHLRRMVDAKLVIKDRSRHPWTFYRLDLVSVAAARGVLDSYAEPPAA